MYSIPQLGFSKIKTDFGTGFYGTSSKRQAERWSKRKAIVDGGHPIVLVFTLDRVKFTRCRVKVLHDVNEWLDFVITHRLYGGLKHSYDIVIGEIADSDVRGIVDEYIVRKGSMTREELYIKLETRNLSDQISFHTAKGLSCIERMSIYRVNT